MVMGGGNRLCGSSGKSRSQMQFTLLFPLLCMLLHCRVRHPQELAPMVELESSATMLNLPS